MATNTQRGVEPSSCTETNRRPTRLHALPLDLFWIFVLLLIMIIKIISSFHLRARSSLPPSRLARLRQEKAKALARI
jgi:hypothetical protein